MLNGIEHEMSGAAEPGTGGALTALPDEAQRRLRSAARLLAEGARRLAVAAAGEPTPEPSTGAGKAAIEATAEGATRPRRARKAGHGPRKGEVR